MQSMQNIPEDTDYYMERTVECGEKRCILQLPKRSQDAAENAAYQLHRLLLETIDFPAKCVYSENNMKML